MKDAQPLVSVIVPVYRHEQYLAQCLESIARQTFLNWECIIINDGSSEPDCITTIAHRVLNQKATILHQEHQGVCGARNRGIEYSQGDYFVCLDADDYLHPEFLARTVPVLATGDANIVFVWAQRIGMRHDQIQPTQFHLFWLLQRNLITITTLCKKSVWQSIGGFDLQMDTGYEDWEFWIRAALAGYRFHGIPAPLVYYRIKSESRDIRARKNRVEAIRTIRHKHAAVYFMPLWKLFSYPRFNGIPKIALLRFWLTGLFFHYVPVRLQRMVFGAYQKLNGE